MSKEVLYMLINGELDVNRLILSENMEIRNEFEEGSECNKLYERVFNAKWRLNDRLGTEEDADIECILVNMIRIGRILAYKMYDYAGNPQIRCFDIDLDKL